MRRMTKAQVEALNPRLRIRPLKHLPYLGNAPLFAAACERRRQGMKLYRIAREVGIGEKSAWDWTWGLKPVRK